MEKPLNYEKTFKIEILNEFANGIYARLLNFVLKNGIDRQDKNNFYNVLLDQFVEMLDLDLFKMSFEELGVLDSYWTNMNSYIKEITMDSKIKEQQREHSKDKKQEQSR
ncbi:hypothetical protein [Lysinibacillus xylanilyticus]|uniref:hypothetical protein n=1 Tax=Lysinibacillus xylanilyticus TaxID=582475 RepID=UPI003CFF1E8A